MSDAITNHFLHSMQLRVSTIFRWEDKRLVQVREVRTTIPMDFQK